MSYTIFCTGSSGLVASHFKGKVVENKNPFVGIDRMGEKIELDLMQPEVVLQYLSEAKKRSEDLKRKPIFFHFAAITLTGNNLTPEQEQLSWDINVQGTKNMLEVAKKLAIPFVHISTDFVFSGGGKEKAYMPDDLQVADSSIYAKTKMEAEKAVLSGQQDQMVSIVRIAFPYGNLEHPKPCLLRKMLGWMDTKDRVSLYSDQHTCPTPITHISASCLKLSDLLAQDKLASGTILHVVGQPTTPYEFGKEIKRIFDKKVILEEGKIGDHGAKNLVLDTEFTELILGVKAPVHREEFVSLHEELLKVNS